MAQSGLSDERESKSEGLHPSHQQDWQVLAFCCAWAMTRRFRQVNRNVHLQNWRPSTNQGNMHKSSKHRHKQAADQADQQCFCSPSASVLRLIGKQILLGIKIRKKARPGAAAYIFIGCRLLEDGFDNSCCCWLLLGLLASRWSLFCRRGR